MSQRQLRTQDSGLVNDSKLVEALLRVATQGANNAIDRGHPAIRGLGEVGDGVGICHIDLSRR